MAGCDFNSTADVNQQMATFTGRVLRRDAKTTFERRQKVILKKLSRKFEKQLRYHIFKEEFAEISSDCSSRG